MQRWSASEHVEHDMENQLRAQWSEERSSEPIPGADENENAPGEDTSEGTDARVAQGERTGTTVGARADTKKAVSSTKSGPTCKGPSQRAIWIFHCALSFAACRRRSQAAAPRESSPWPPLSADTSSSGTWILARIKPRSSPSKISTARKSDPSSSLAALLVHSLLVAVTYEKVLEYWHRSEGDGRRRRGLNGQNRSRSRSQHRLPETPIYRHTLPRHRSPGNTLSSCLRLMVRAYVRNLAVIWGVCFYWVKGGSGVVRLKI